MNNSSLQMHCLNIICQNQGSESRFIWLFFLQGFIVALFICWMYMLCLHVYRKIIRFGLNVQPRYLLIVDCFNTVFMIPYSFKLNIFRWVEFDAINQPVISTISPSIFEATLFAIYHNRQLFRNEILEYWFKTGYKYLK